MAEVTWRRPRGVLALVGVFLAVAGALGHDVANHLKAAGFTDPASESERATALLRDRLGFDATPGLVALVRARDGGRIDLADPAVRAEVERIATGLRHARHVGRVEDPVADPRLARLLVARDGRSLVLAAHLATQDIESDGGDAATDARRRTASRTLDVSLGGFAAGFHEVNDQVRGDLEKAELIAFPVLAILLLLVFRSVVAAAIPLAIGGISIAGTFLVLRVMSMLVDTSIFALNIATALSLGLAVDYALLLVSRYREEIARGGATREAHRRTLLSAGRTSLFSGFTVAASMAALGLFPQRFLYSIAVAGAAVGILASILAVLVVGALLRLLGERINALPVRRGPSVGPSVGATSDRWYRFAAGVMRRPATVAAASTLVMLAAAAPLVTTRLTGPSAEAVPPGQPSYAVNRAVERDYGREVSEPITVTVTDPASPGQLVGLRQRIARLPHVAVAGPFRRAAPDTAFASVAADHPATSGQAQDVVRAIRAIEPSRGARLLVSGNTARFLDEKASLADHAPLVVALVALLTGTLLFLLTGSVVLPLKALLMNALTLAATLGVVVLAFQDGWLDGPLGYQGPAAVEVTSLVFLFAVLFGLATDYAVLVLARIKEQRDLGVPNEEAVATGMARTGRVITAAAAMIAVVFLAFGVSSVFFMKQMAVGQSVGVLLDATVVRALLVPALMRLFGAWNWWAPRPLARVHARFAIQEG